MRCASTPRLFMLLGAFWLVAQPGVAQVPPDPVEESLPGRSSAPVFNPVPSSEEPLHIEESLPEPEPPTPAEGPVEGPPISFLVRDIQVLGNTLFYDEIENLVKPLEGREITLTDLLSLRTEITNLYVKNGYVSSGAFVPTNQDLNDEVVEIQVVEGEVEQIQVRGLDRLREGYVRDRITQATQPPLNIHRLEEGLQLLQSDPVLQSVDAELIAGSGPGQNILILDLSEADAFSGSLAVDNYRSPSIGSLQASAAIDHINLLGFGDRLNLGYSFTEGLDSYQLGYSLPVNELDGTVEVSYQEADSDIVEDRFQATGIRSESETLSFNFRQPIQRSLSNEFTLGLGFDLRESRSFILDDIPFSFSLGPEEGVSNVSVLRFSQEWVNRDINTVLAARSQFNLGLDIFDATVNNTGTDGRFFSWLGQFQWVEQLAPNTLLLTRFNAQLTPDSLLPLERFSMGGIDTVRGYSQNQLVTDNAITFSTELRFPLASNLQLTPFLDAGGGWNNQTPNPDPAFLLGTGLGLRWYPLDYLNFRLDYGIPLISDGNEGNSFQENGLYFSINLLPF
jgi:hemolysin activation/secretion protein